MSLHDDDSRYAAVYAELTRPTAPTEEPVAAVRRRLRRRAVRRRAAGAVLAACVAAVVAVGAFQVVEPSGAGTGAGAAAGAAASPSGALPAAGASGCVAEYNEKTLRNQDWAADATVTRVGRSLGRGDVSVQLEVHTWYRGGSGTTLQVRMPSPRSQVENEPPAYEVGTRLLLSGSLSAPDSRPRAGRTVWTCGFTRYYDTDTAAVWAKVFSR